MARLKERRRRNRISVALPIKIKYNNKEISTKTKNISVLGTYVQIDEEIPLGTSLDIKIKIPKKAREKRQINCAAAIFRCQSIGTLGLKNQYGIGIFFRSFIKKDGEYLSKYIDGVLLREKKIGKIFMRRRKRRQSRQKGGKG